MSVDNNIDFKDHIVEYPNRFKMTNVSPGVVELVPTWIEAPDQILQAGTPVDSELFKKLKQNVTLYQQTFTTTNNQTIINLDRHYLVGQSRVSLTIGGVKQYSGQDYTETDTNTLMMTMPQKGGLKAEVIIFTASQAIAEDLFEETMAAIAATQSANEAAVNANKAYDATFFNFLSPLSTFAAIATTYPSPKLYDAVLVDGAGDANEGKIYRWEGSSWVYRQKVTAGPVRALQAEMDTYNDQPDFVSMLARHTDYDKMMFKKENSVGWLTVTLFRGNEHISWIFRNNTYDDYMILGECFQGTKTFSDVIYQNKDYATLTGTWVTTASTAHYTTQVGAKFDASIDGERIDFNFYSDNRGGIWEFILDGKPETATTVSTYSDTIASPRAVTLFQGLENKTHTISGTFKGADPAHAPSGGTARGWVWFSNNATPSTLRSYRKFTSNTRDRELFAGYSNKEFAIRMRKAGVGTHQFVPMHSNIGTAYNAEAIKIIVNGQTIDPATLTIGEFLDCSDFKVSQKIYARNPDSGTENLATITTTVSINKKGIAEISGKMEVLTNIEVADGYFLMGPVAKASIDRLATSINNYYSCTKTDGSKTYMAPEKDRVTSYVFTSSASKDYAMAMTIHDYRNSLRAGKPMKYSEATNTWIEHRDTTITKLYASVFRNATLNAGEVYRWSGSLIATKLTRAHDLI